MEKAIEAAAEALTVPDEYPHKIKTPFANIVVTRYDGETPYYGILYLNTQDGCFHIGFGSYTLNLVQQWLATEFEICTYSDELVVRKKAHWRNRAQHNDFLWAECSNCGFTHENYQVVTLGRSSREYVGVKWKFCPICGCEMVLENEPKQSD